MTQIAAESPPNGGPIEYLAPQNINLSRKTIMSADGKLTAKQQAKIIAQAKELLATVDGLSKEKFARAVGMKRATFSKVLGRSYGSSPDKFLRRIASFLLSYADKAAFAPSSSLFAPTSIARQIMAVCDLATDAPSIGIVKTPSGWGKTSALQEIALKRGPAQCMYIQAGEACVSPRDLVAAIAKRFSITTHKRSRAELYDAVRDKLAATYMLGKGVSFLVIIDEATTLRPSAINMLRNLHDDPAARPAIVLADTLARMDGFLYARRAESIAGGNEQLRSRSKAQFKRTANDEIHAADVQLVAEARLKSLGHRGKLTGRSLKYLVDLARSGDALRDVTSRIENLHYYAARQGLVADFSVTQLDWIAPLSGAKHKIDHGKGESIPFAKVSVA